MKLVAGLGIVLLIAAPAAAQLAPYWIPDDGCEIAREGDYNAVEYYQGVEGTLGLRCTTDHSDFWLEHYTGDGNNGLCLASIATLGMNNDVYEYNPPLKVLQLPLTSGLTWTSESVRTHQGGGTVPRTYTLTSTVVGPRTIDTVIGPLDVIEVTQVLTIVPHPDGPWTFTRLLNEQFGNVHGLLGTEGCTAVPTDAVSWGLVKSLYR
jgi:hypothetical protein